MIVADDRGELWQATILERHERLCQDGFRIHWDGTKKEKVDWVECTRIVNFIPGDADVDLQVTRRGIATTNR